MARPRGDDEIVERRRRPKLFVILAGTNDLLAYPQIEEDKIVNAISAPTRRGGLAVVCTKQDAAPEESESPSLTKRRYRLNELIVEKFGEDRVVDTPPRRRAGWLHLTAGLRELQIDLSCPPRRDEALPAVEEEPPPQSVKAAAPGGAPTPKTSRRRTPRPPPGFCKLRTPPRPRHTKKPQ